MPQICRFWTAAITKLPLPPFQLKHAHPRTTRDQVFDPIEPPRSPFCCLLLSYMLFDRGGE
ncbi:hypothetical protein I7I48_01065 [Histoplasma ohiense]|nr:hypothetical protein I7I48_01065 [Histoplasma ohiense (nom. inval.)]